MCIHSEISIHGSIFRVIWLSSWYAKENSSQYEARATVWCGL
ncbi:hypothetical protein BRADI_4g44734v3 [Brachypodium distachyon]|uniref:Uncharacterized protein n=1 Tax=Brachypodium distachyon TaxID=15368 RepID=A0A2K2CU91_BRADI|nr:hypothetical protein BRADI_4g44734v3 [Brachypodium distachyon]